MLAGGTGVAQALTILTAPVFTRLYSPEDFGLAAVFAGLLGLILVVSTLKYELAVPLPESDQDAIDVVALCIISVLATSVVALALVFAFGSGVAGLLGVPELADYLWLVPVAVLLGGSYVAFSYWATRTKRFPVIATTRVWQALVSIAIKAVAFKAGAVALLFAQVASHGVGASSLGRLVLARAELARVSWRGIWRSAVRYRRFPIYSSGSGLLNVAGIQAPPLLFAAIFGPAAAGLYALANAVLHLPMSLIGTAIGQVFYATAAESRRLGTLGGEFANLHEKLAHIALPPMLLLMLVAPDLFALVFGEAWRQAGDFARWMALWLYFSFVTSPLSSVFFVLEKQAAALIFQITKFLARALAIIAGAWIGDLGLTIILFSSVSAAAFIGLLLWLTLLVNQPIKMLLRPTFYAFLIGVLCALPVIGVQVFSSESIRVFLVATLGSVLILGLRYFLMLRSAY